MNEALAALRHHVSGAIERGEKEAIVGIHVAVTPDMAAYAAAKATPVVCPHCGRDCQPDGHCDAWGVEHGQSMAADTIDLHIEAIAYCLRVWNVATWAGWTIIRIPGVTARTVRIEATEACGTVHLKDYPARTGHPMPFDNHDVRRLLLPYGAVLAR